MGFPTVRKAVIAARGDDSKAFCDKLEASGLQISTLLKIIKDSKVVLFMWFISVDIYYVRN